MFQDLRYGMRMLLKHKGFTLVAALSLALGIGANTALFSVVDAVLLRSLPVKEPSRLVLFEWQSGSAFRTNGMRAEPRFFAMTSSRKCDRRERPRPTIRSVIYSHSLLFSD
jgi:hypothetical protein